MASMSNVGRRAYTSTFSAKSDSSQPAGLGNWDNSCFQNSIIQGLSSLKHLPPYLTALTPGLSLPSDDASTTVGALRAFVNELTDPSNNGQTLYTPGILKNMSTIQQQDAQEYFSKLLDRVDKDIEIAAKAACKPPGLEADLARDDSVASQHSDDSGYQSLPVPSKAGSELVTIRNPLEGLWAQRVACTACGFSEGLSMIPFNCLTLDFDAGVGNYTLDELLDRYVGLESIGGVDCTKCTLVAYRHGLQRLAKAVPMAAQRLLVVERMLEEDGFDEELVKKLRIPDAKKVSSTKTKQVAVARPPPSLAIHMQRSVFDPYSGSSYKNLAAVQFPAVLNIGPWCIGSAPGVQLPTPASASVGGEEPQEQWILDAKASMVAGGMHASQISGPIYELRAIITHYGRHENGHYVCYRKHPHRRTHVSHESENEERASPTPSANDGSDDVDTIYNETSPDLTVDATPSAMDMDEPYLQDVESQWWRLSDETVTPVSEDDVLAQGGVFMLFYDCVDPNSVLVTPSIASDEKAMSEDVAEIYSSPIHLGRNSPSQSEESDATLCNDVSAQRRNLSEVSLVTDTATESRACVGKAGPPNVLVTELMGEEDQTTIDDPQPEQTKVRLSEVNSLVNVADQVQDVNIQGASETSVTKVVDHEPAVEDIVMQNVHYEPAPRAETELSESSSMTMGREHSADDTSVTMGREDSEDDKSVDSPMSMGPTKSVSSSQCSSVTLAAEEWVQPGLSDAMDSDASTAHKENVRV